MSSYSPISLSCKLIKTEIILNLKEIIFSQAFKNLMNFNPGENLYTVNGTIIYGIVGHFVKFVCITLLRNHVNILFFFFFLKNQKLLLSTNWERIILIFNNDGIEQLFYCLLYLFESRRFCLTRDMKNLNSFVRGSFEWSFSELCFSDAPLWNQ